MKGAWLLIASTLAACARPAAAPGSFDAGTEPGGRAGAGGQDAATAASGHGGATPAGGHGGATGLGGRNGAGGLAGSVGAGSAGGGAPTGSVPPAGSTLLLIGQSGRRPHAEYVAATGSVPAGASVYAELYTGRLLNWEHEALVEYLARDYPGSYVEVGLSWKDDRVGAGYCDLSATCAGNCCAPTDDDAPALPELDIVAGRYDAAIDSFAAYLAAHAGLRFLVRLDYEVSPDLFCTRSGDCTPYVAAFNYLAQRIRGGAGTTSVQFVFHPTRGWAERMYPGAANTDWVGFSVFNNDVCLPATDGTTVVTNCPSTETVDSNLAADLTWARQTAGKPILVAESTVQNTADDTPAAFADYLARLTSIVEANDLMRGLTYINMKWTGDWVYGENWTSGAFADTDSRVERDPADQSAWCAHLAGGRYVGPDWHPAPCGVPPAATPPLPPDLDAPVYNVVVLATNQCLRIPGTAIDDGGALVRGACSGDGRSRFRVAAAANGQVQIFNDATWLCLEAGAATAGTPLTQSPCAAVATQMFTAAPAATGASTDFTWQTAGGQCVDLASTTASGNPGFVLQPCWASSQLLRLLLQPF